MTSGDFDRKDVGVTTDGGLTYTRLNDCSPLADGSGTMISHSFDISEFAGSVVQVIWVYDTIDNLEAAAKKGKSSPLRLLRPRVR